MTADILDCLLAQLSAYGPDLTNGFTSHAPMVAEALVVMGRPEAAQQWVQAHLHEGTARPDASSAIDDWPAALGREDRFADWAELMRAELRRDDWREVLDRWCARLAPGFAAAATHGIIRTAHAARAVAARASEPRLAELADGLALWASSYQALPGRRDAAVTPMRDPSDALARVPRVPLARRRNGGAITTALTVLAELPAFDPVIAYFDPGDDLIAAGQQLARAFSDVFLAQARDPLTAIVFTHAITSTTAVLWLAPLIRDTTTRELLIHAWQTGAALLAVYGEDPVPIDCTPEPTPELIHAAIAHGDDHVIKLSGACAWLREQTGDSLFAALPSRARSLIV